MAKYINPAFTLTSKKYSTATNSGPTSSPIVISVTDQLDVTEVRQKVVDVSDTHAILFKSTLTSGEVAFTDDTDAAGTDGGFIFLRNLTEGMATTADIYIGHGSTNDLADGGGGEAIRLMTLKPGEFAYFGWDLEADIIVDASATVSGALEAYFFVRTTSV